MWDAWLGAFAIVVIGCGGGAAGGGGGGGGTGAASDTTTPDQKTCEPGRCLEDFASAIERDRGQARACYEAGHAKQPGLAGRIIVNFEVDDQGVVVDASQGVQGDQITDAGVVACVIGVVKGIQFAPSTKPGKTTRAFHRFEFTPP
jgi:hypothetical protein